VSKTNQLQLLHEKKFFEIVIDEVKDGRIKDREGNWYHDYVTTGYLGVDHLPELIEKGTEYSKKWGSIANWSRMEVDPVIYTQLEDSIKSWMGCSNVILGHTITISNFSVLPWLAKDGFLICDSIVHTVVWEACRLARDHGAQIKKFDHQDLDDLERVLSELPRDKNKIIAIDGVYSISTEMADIEKMVPLCEKYNAYIYVDDAHGLGVYGKGDGSDWGKKGNGIWNYYNVNKDRIFYVSNFGKAFGTTVAFLCYPDAFKSELKSNCLQYLFSAPPNPYAIGSTQAVMEWNERDGDQAREKLLGKVKYFVDGIRAAGVEVKNLNYHPVVFVKYGEFDNLLKGAEYLRQQGILGGYRAYPVVPHDACGIRFSITNDHTTEVLEHTIKSIANSF
jgi:7-keto-8-aminopelargonate synthetase-like enzyme